MEDVPPQCAFRDWSAISALDLSRTTLAEPAQSHSFTLSWRIPQSKWNGYLDYLGNMNTVNLSELTLQSKPECRLCKHCEGFIKLLGQKYEGDHYSHCSSIQVLQASSQNCPLCRIMLQRFQDTDQLESILRESANGYPTVLQFVGQTSKGLLNYQEDPHWKGLIGLEIYCGEDGFNDDWSCSLGLFTDKGTSVRK